MPCKPLAASWLRLLTRPLSGRGSRGQTLARSARAPTRLRHSSPPTTSTSSTSARRTTPRAAGLAALAAGKHVVCEKPLATSVADARRAGGAGRRPAGWRRVPFVYRFHPTVREARARVAGGRGRAAGCCTAPTCRTGSPRRDDATGGSTRRPGGASRAFADIGAHWCDLVEFVSGHRIARLAALHRRPRPARAVGRSAPRTPRRPLRDRRGATGSWRSARSRRAARTGCGSRSTARESARLRPGAPGALWVGGRSRPAALRGDPGHLGPGRGPLLAAARRAPAGLPGLLRPLRRRRLRRHARRPRPDGLPTFADGVRAADAHRRRARLGRRPSTWQEVTA